MVRRKTGKSASIVAYKCPECRAWHLGNNRGLAAARIDQLLEQSAERDRAIRLSGARKALIDAEARKADKAGSEGTGERRD